MNIKIIRGTNQIGGSAVEITTSKARIIFDLGEELCDKPQKLSIDGVNEGESSCDAVFFSHNHGDHIGLIDSINNDIPLYMGEISKELLKLFAERTKERNYKLKTLDRVKTFKRLEKITIKDIIVTPFYVDHSAFDAYMFLIEADGKRVLYTGDFRDHGFIGNRLEEVLKKYIGKVDVVICEGTAFSRKDVKVLTEYELQSEIGNIIKDNKHVFVMCSSTNIYRIESICNSIKDERYKLSDDYQCRIINYICDKFKDTSPYYCNTLSEYNVNDEEAYREKGFVMFIRQGKYYKNIIDKYPEAKIIYSMWHGYLDRENDGKETIRQFFGDREIIEKHTSGHATIDAIKKLIEITKPDKLLPIHTEEKSAFKEIAGKAYIDLNDNEIVEV